VAALLCAAAGAAGAQALPKVRATPTPAPPREVTGSDQPPPVTLTADNVVSHIGGVAQASGGVDLKRQDLELKADLLSYDQLSDTAHAEGHVRIARGLDWFSADRLDLELTRYAGTLLDTEYEIGSRKAGGKAQRIELEDRDHSTLYQADYTACPRDLPAGHEPDWIIQGDRIDIDMATNQGRAQHAVLRFLGVPILAAPVLTFPVTADRKSGWLPPTAEASNRSGPGLGVPYYWNLRPNIDATFTPAYITRRGPTLTSEVRYLEPGDLGQTTLYLLPDDKVEHDTRGSLEWAHEGVRGDWLTYSARVQRVSDDTYWKDFPGQLSAVTQRLLPTDLSGVRRFTPWGPAGEIDAYARVQRFQTLQDLEDPSAVIQVPYQRSPQLGVRGSLLLDDRTRLEFETEANRFDLSDKVSAGDLAAAGLPPDNREGGTRVHLIGTVSRAFVSDWGRIEPRLSLNGATYHTDAPMSDGRTTATRWIPTFSTDSAASFERQTSLFGRDLVQTLEPRLLYVYTPYHDQTALPLYDTAPKDFNEVSIYSDNQFTGIDRISDENQLTAGATTRFNDAVNGRELLRLGVAQRLLFKDQALTTDGTPDTRKLSDLLIWGSSSAMEHWSYDGTVEINPSSSWTQRAIVSARYHPGPFRSLSLTYRFARGSSESYELAGQWPLYHNAPGTGHSGGSRCGDGGTLYGVGRVDYSVSDRRSTYAVGGVEYDANCWIARFVVERTSTGVNESTNHYMLQLELNGLSALGFGSPTKALRNNVPGYQPLRDDTGLFPSSTASSTTSQ
jgi:LPS-assembly protein